MLTEPCETFLRVRLRTVLEYISYATSFCDLDSELHARNAVGICRNDHVRVCLVRIGLFAYFRQDAVKRQWVPT